MKIYANRHDINDLDSYVGKDIWVLVKHRYYAYIKIFYKQGDRYYYNGILDSTVSGYGQLLIPYENIINIISAKEPRHDMHEWDAQIVEPLEVLTTQELIDAVTEVYQEAGKI